MMPPHTSGPVLFSRLANYGRLKHLQLIVRIVELGSLQKAADSTGMSQPAATQALAGMEEVLGIALFERHARGMRPTPHAAQLIKFAQRALDAMSDLAGSVAEFQAGATGVVRIASVSAAVSGLLSRTLPDFHRGHPDIVVEVSEVEQDRLFSMMAEQGADLFFCRTPNRVAQGYQFIPLEKDQYVVVVAADHRLAKHPRLILADCKDETWLAPPRGVPVRRAFESWCEMEAFNPKLCRITTRSVALAWAMIKELGLLGVFPYHFIRQLVIAGELACLPLEIPGKVNALGVMHDQDGPKGAARTLVDHLLHFQAAQN